MKNNETVKNLRAALELMRARMAQGHAVCMKQFALIQAALYEAECDGTVN